MSSSLDGVPAGGFSENFYVKQHKMDKYLKEMENLLGSAHYGGGLALMYAMYVVLPASMSFQEGSMNHEVQQQKDLTKILGDFKAMQADMDSMQDLHKTQDQVVAITQDFESHWGDALTLANSSVFGERIYNSGSGSDAFTQLADQLYNQSGKFFNRSGDSYGTLSYKDGQTHFSASSSQITHLADDMITAWKGAEAQPYSKDRETHYSGDNGEFLKEFQDAFNSVDTAASGQQGTVQSVLKYMEQMYSSIESAMKNVGQGMNALQKNAIDGTRPS